MRRLLTIDDFKDIYIKSLQRGRKFIFSKFSFSNSDRTKSSFNDEKLKNANWAIVPEIRSRWNYLISGNPNTSYEAYASELLKNRGKVKMLSIGSGVCTNEINFARLNPNMEIVCLDFSEKLFIIAKEKADKEKLNNIKFLAKDIYDYEFPKNYFNVIHFHASLHHFKNLNTFIGKIHSALPEKGLLLINEYTGPNRIQYPKKQINEINTCLNLIPKKFKNIFKTNLYKNRYYGSGIIRMIISDPSECVESEMILPTIKKFFNPIKEVGYGGNILMPLFKDISHNFLVLNQEKKRCLEEIFKREDDFIKKNKSDYFFGIYEKKHAN